MKPVHHAIVAPARLLAGLALAAFVVVAVPATAQAAVFADDFNREDSTDLGPGWIEGGAGVQIVGNSLRSASGDSGYAVQPDNDADSVSVDAQAGLGISYVALLAGGTSDTEDFAWVKVQSNSGGSNFDTVYFYSGVNGNGGGGSPTIMVIPAGDQFASARMELSLAGAVATLTLDTDFDGNVDLTYSSTYSAAFTGSVGGVGVYGGGIADNFGGVNAAPLMVTTIAGTTEPAAPVFGSGDLVLTVDADETPTGSVEVTIGDQTPMTVDLVDGVATVSLDALDAGSYTYTASFPGDASFVASTTSGAFEIAPAPTATTVTFAPAAPAYGTEVTLTATVTSDAGTPAGGVTFMDGDVELGDAALVDGVATLTVPSFIAGEHAITANYLGTGNYAISEGSASVAVAKGASATSLTAPAKIAEGADVALTATVNPPTGVTEPATGTVEFFAGATSLGTANVVDGVATFTTNSFAHGDITLSAVYSGSELLDGSSAEASMTVLKAPDALVPPQPEVTEQPTAPPTEEGTEVDSGERADEEASDAPADEELSTTGADAGPLVAFSAMLLLAGGLVLALTRRRTTS